jgi:hypothetical protein
VEPRSARGQRYAIAAAGEGCEGLFKLALVFAGVRVPSIGNGFADILDFLVGDPRTRDRDTRRHHSSLSDHPATLRGFEKPPFSAPGLEQARILKGLVTIETIEQRFEIPAA